MKYVHTNIIAKDSAKLIDFYKTVFKCKSIGQTRDLKGECLDKMTGISNAHIVGEHLCLPGYGEDKPTLEIFSYDNVETGSHHKINQCGIAHLAFEVDNVEKTLEEILSAGGTQFGEIVKTEYADGGKATFVYTTDIEGNIIELQNWS